MKAAVSISAYLPGLRVRLPTMSSREPVALRVRDVALNADHRDDVRWDDRDYRGR